MIFLLIFRYTDMTAKLSDDPMPIPNQHEISSSISPLAAAGAGLGVTVKSGMSG